MFTLACLLTNTFSRKQSYSGTFFSVWRFRCSLFFEFFTFFFSFSLLQYKLKVEIAFFNINLKQRLPRLVFLCELKITVPSWAKSSRKKAVIAKNCKKAHSVNEILFRFFMKWEKNIINFLAGSNLN